MCIDQGDQPSSRHTSRSNRRSGMNTSRQYQEDSYRSITTGFDGMTESFQNLDLTTGRSERDHSRSYANPTCLSFKKSQRKLLYPVIK